MRSLAVALCVLSFLAQAASAGWMAGRMLMFAVWFTT